MTLWELHRASAQALLLQQPVRSVTNVHLNRASYHLETCECGPTAIKIRFENESNWIDLIMNVQTTLHLDVRQLESSKNRWRWTEVTLNVVDRVIDARLASDLSISQSTYWLRFSRCLAVHGWLTTRDKKKYIYPVSSSSCVKETSMSGVRGQHTLTERQRQSGWRKSERQSCCFLFSIGCDELCVQMSSQARSLRCTWSGDPSDSVTPALEAPAMRLRLDKSRLIVCGCLRVQRQILGSKD